MLAHEELVCVFLYTSGGAKPVFHREAAPQLSEFLTISEGGLQASLDDVESCFVCRPGMVEPVKWCSNNADGLPGNFQCWFAGFLEVGGLLPFTFAIGRCWCFWVECDWGSDAHSILNLIKDCLC